MQKSTIFGSYFAVIALAMGSQISHGIADGALALGLPADVARLGFASGAAVNAADMDNARKSAIERCHRSRNASAQSMKLCKVIATFRDQCFAIAIDPKAGTPGVGWGIAETLAKADQQALAQCRTTAGVTRQQFCAVLQDADHLCDGSAK
jgi:hypothetical protein